MKDAGHEALERGKAVAQDAVHSATDTAQERGKQEASALQERAGDKAREATQAT
jgi:hypothetical protein